MIGRDFQKIEWSVGGLELLEPNAFFGDVIILVVSLYFYRRIQKASVFNALWAKFYLCFGISFMLGGFGHLLFNYCGLWGKAPSWLMGIIATFYVEQAMLSLWINARQKRTLLKISQLKMIVFMVLEVGLLLNVSSSQDPAIGLLIPTLNSILGLGFTLGYLGYYYQRKSHDDFKYFWFGSLALLPNAVVQGMKINLHPWFDRNDLSHVLLLIGVSIYFVGVKKLSDYNTQMQNMKP
jgi:hypothetical protein